MIKIVIDAFGGDHAPIEIVKGAIDAVNKNSEISIILSGKSDALNSTLKDLNYKGDRISILDASEVITNDESPTEAIRRKKDSSLVKAFDLAKEDEEVAGVISAGSTGAVLTGAFMKLGRMKGIHRPALCPVLPTANNDMVCLCDCGANMDCKPEYLDQFAIMGSAYLKVLGKENPRVALLNVGTEDHKGDTRTKEAFELISRNKNINFVGNMEARDLLSGQFDLVVTDGFAGNVLLKSTEGAIKSLLKVLKTEIKSSFISKIGALFMKKSFGNVKKKFDYNKHGGAVLLGCKKLVVKAHGSSKAESIANCVEQLYTMAKGGLLDSISNNLKISGLSENE